MSISPRSYGSVPEVAALTRRYTNGGAYDATTNPTITAVEKWIDHVSAILNTSLAAEGFEIPLKQADAKVACAGIVIEAAADLCHAANSAGRFFTDTALARGVSPLRAIRREIDEWVKEQAAGLESLGAARSRTLLGSILSRDTDESGEDIFPIFQRKGFGNTFTDWTSRDDE